MVSIYIYKIYLIRFDGKHVAFGKVFDGMNVLNAIEAVGSIDGTPKANVSIVDCGVLEGLEINHEEEAHSHDSHAHH
jgi:cyclophilin family peptidyl-prolyl cis-trans isomerase